MPSSRGRQRVPPELSMQVVALWGNDCWLGMPGCTRVSDTSDHIVPDKLGGPTIVSNLRRACRHCNSMRHERVLSGYGARYHAIIGPPNGGKSTYVREHQQPGDIVVDFDALATCLLAGWDGQHNQPQYVRELAVGAWYGAYRRAVSVIEPVDVWIVKTLPATPRSPRLLDEWVALDYDIVVCDPGKPEVMRRHERTRRGVPAERGIVQWYRTGVTQQAVDVRRKARRHRLAELGLGHADMLDAREPASSPPESSRPRW